VISEGCGKAFGESDMIDGAVHDVVLIAGYRHPSTSGAGAVRIVFPYGHYNVKLIGNPSVR
jgi:hypothetical protein